MPAEREREKTVPWLALLAIAGAAARSLPMIEMMMAGEIACKAENDGGINHEAKRRTAGDMAAGKRTTVTGSFHDTYTHRHHPPF